MGIEKEILSRITMYREQKGWSEYQLAEHSGLPQSTISSWYQKNSIPTLPSLKKICDSFGISLSQLFADENEMVALTESQKEFLKLFQKLDNDQQHVIILLLQLM